MDQNKFLIELCESDLTDLAIETARGMLEKME
jgi:hypothetical protein